MVSRIEERCDSLGLDRYARVGINQRQLKEMINLANKGHLSKKQLRSRRHTQGGSQLTEVTLGRERLL